MELTMRRYRGEDDYWRIRDFLRQVFRLNDWRELSWQAYRFDYWRWHGIENLGHGRLEEHVFLWETADGRIAAVLNGESPGHAFLQVHPALRSGSLEEEMIAVAEEHLVIADPNDRRRLIVWANEQDDLRQDVLRRRGYARSEPPEYQRRRSLEAPVHTARALGDGAELLERCYASGRAFHPDEIRYAVENREDVGWYRNIQNAPLYRRDLDLVAVASDGAIASFCTVWFDDVTRSGALEPVGTAPAHQRRGLGKAVIVEGLRRLKRMGATMAYVGSYSRPAHALYASVGFTEYDLSRPWKKEC